MSEEKPAPYFDEDDRRYMTVCLGEKVRDNLCRLADCLVEQGLPGLVVDAMPKPGTTSGDSKDGGDEGTTDDEPDEKKLASRKKKTSPKS